GKQKSPRGEVRISEKYSLDGRETEFTPQSPPNAKGKRKATWLANGRGILVEDEINDGQATRRVTRKLTLSSDGKTLIVDLFIDDSRGSFELKRVYNKVGEDLLILCEATGLVQASEIPGITIHFLES